MPSKKTNSKKVPWKSVGSSGVLVKSVARGMKTSNSRNRSLKLREMDSLHNGRFFYAKVLKKEVKRSPADQTISATPSLDKRTVKLPNIQKLFSGTSVLCKKDRPPGEGMHRNPSGRHDDRFAGHKAEYLSLLRLVPTHQITPNCLPKQATKAAGFLDNGALSQSLNISVKDQSSEDNHHVCAGVKLNRKFSYEVLLPENAGPDEMKRGKIITNCHQMSKNHVAAKNHSTRFTIRSTTGSDWKDTLSSDSVSIPRSTVQSNELLSPWSCDSFRLNEATAEDCSSDELCVVSVRSLAPGKEDRGVDDSISQDEPEITTPNAPHERGAGQRLVLKQSALDPSKKFLYLDVDYSLTKPVSNTKGVPAFIDIDRRGVDSNVTGKFGRETNTSRSETYSSVENTKRRGKHPRKRKTVKSKRSSKSVDTAPKTEPSEFSKSRNKSVRRAISHDLEASTVLREEIASPSAFMTNDAVSTTRECVLQQRQSSSTSYNCGFSLPKTNSRISELRAMLRKKEADLEEVRKSLLNFDDAMPG